MQRYYTIGFGLMLAAAMNCLLTACNFNRQPAAPSAERLVETISSGPITLTFTADPRQIHLDRDILLTMGVSAPSNIEVRLPPIENRLKGFVLNGAFTRDGHDDTGKPVKEYCFRLTPTLAEEYRIAPMAITWINREREPYAEGWFATRPLILHATGLTKAPPGATLNDITAPIWIYPPFKTVALWMAIVVGALGTVYLMWRLSRYAHKAIKLRRMSPRERALYELNELLAQDLVGKQKIKEFYLQLTMIVRRYIERAHAIRAPEQTTEEFLVAVTHNPGFNREVLRKLRVFLQTSDLVKFAAYHPEPAVVDQTLATARDYIETDEKATGAINQIQNAKSEFRNKSE